jgi:hypothetical protein
VLIAILIGLVDVSVQYCWSGLPDVLNAWMGTAGLA